MAAAARKAPDAFRTISEVASELEVPQHVLRFWESRFGAIKPLKRGGGRRYYRPDDIDLLRGIKALLYRDGLTIKGVQKILREQGVRALVELGRGETQLLRMQPCITLVEDVGAAAPDGGSGGSDPAADNEAEAPDRAHFERLLDELMQLKTRLRSARR
jgi:DNA-binding transcriptional MerR regulator